MSGLPALTIGFYTTGQLENEDSNQNPSLQTAVATSVQDRHVPRPVVQTSVGHDVVPLLSTLRNSDRLTN